MQNDDFEVILRDLQTRGELVSIYPSARTPRASVEGFVDFVAQDSVLLRRINERGHYDGFGWRLLENIFRVEYASEYNRKIEFLFEARQQKHPSFLQPLEGFCDLKRETLLAAQRNNLLVCLEIFSRELTEGIVREVGDENVTLELVTVWGHNDGISVVALESITSINCDNDDLQDRKSLASWAQTLPPNL